MANPSFGNLFVGLPGRTADEVSEDLVEQDGVRFERIVSTGQASPEGFWYESSDHEFVLVVQGEGELEFEDGSRRRLMAGDWCLLSAGCRHRVRSTAPDQVTRWLAVHWKQGA